MTRPRFYLAKSRMGRNRRRPELGEVTAWREMHSKDTLRYAMFYQTRQLRAMPQFSVQ